MKLIISTLVWMLLSLVAQHSYGQDQPKCPPIIIPSFTYQYQQDLKSGFGAELNLWFVASKCDCNAPFGGLCYLWGSTAALKTQYYPQAKTFDLSGSYGYRMLFLKPELTAGYSFVNAAYGKSFLHIDPALGLDFAAANLSVGYSFRSEKIDDQTGGVFFRVAVTPLIFFSKSKTNRVLSDYRKASKAELKNVKASF